MVHVFEVEFCAAPAGWLAWDEETEVWAGDIDGPADIGGDPEDWVAIVSEAVAGELSGGYVSGRWRGWTWGPK